MGNEFKQCPNGHYYQGDSCPYCKTTTNNDLNASGKTQVFMGNNNENIETKLDPTSDPSLNTTKGGGHTEIINPSGQMNGSRPVYTPPGRTVFGDELGDNLGGSYGDNSGYRTARKLVGWLVSYSFDAMGVDYKLYEGKNVIGRDDACNITVNDGMISGNHALLLFRAGKYSLSDNESSHGTFVNDKDIELVPVYLSDGDVIRMGQTEFRFRTSF